MKGNERISDSLLSEWESHLLSTMNHAEKLILPAELQKPLTVGNNDCLPNRRNCRIHGGRAYAKRSLDGRTFRNASPAAGVSKGEFQERV